MTGPWESCGLWTNPDVHVVHIHYDTSHNREKWNIHVSETEHPYDGYMIQINSNQTHNEYAVKGTVAQGAKVK